MKTEKENIAGYADLNRREFIVLLSLSVGVITLGISSSTIMDMIDPVISQILEIIAAKKK